MKRAAVLVLGVVLMLQGAAGTGFTTSRYQVDESNYRVHPPAGYYRIVATELPDGYYDKITMRQKTIPIGAILSLCDKVSYEENGIDCSVRGAFLEYALKKNRILTKICTAHMSFDKADTYHMYLKVYKGSSYFYVNPSEEFPDNVITQHNVDWPDYDRPLYIDDDLSDMLSQDPARGFTTNPQEYAWWTYPELQKANQTLYQLMDYR